MGPWILLTKCSIYQLKIFILVKNKKNVKFVHIDEKLFNFQLKVIHINPKMVHSIIRQLILDGVT